MILLAGKRKTYIKRRKRYILFVRRGPRGPLRQLKRHFKSATRALEYGQAVVERYNRLLPADQPGASQA